MRGWQSRLVMEGYTAGVLKHSVAAVGYVWFPILIAGHFENILSENSVSDQTKILVVNAAYFVGKWMKKFPESETKECPFRVNKVSAA